MTKTYRTSVIQDYINAHRVGLTCIYNSRAREADIAECHAIATALLTCAEYAKHEHRLSRAGKCTD